jgi:hypothetical protein
MYQLLYLRKSFFDPFNCNISLNSCDTTTFVIKLFPCSARILLEGEFLVFASSCSSSVLTCAAKSLFLLFTLPTVLVNLQVHNCICMIQRFLYLLVSVVLVLLRRALD